ncbi:MAG TPA: hypothetical protein VN325_27175 [Steroidobacteraceae bacterium]|nr:hypothetical protein [Steroidobacteraceae bacterium]
MTDVKTLRDRARKNIGECGVSFTYKGNVDKAIEILQTVLATEIVCVLHYTMHAIAATGLSSEGVKAKFEQHAKEEQEHLPARRGRARRASIPGCSCSDPRIRCAR